MGLWRAFRGRLGGRSGFGEGSAWWPLVVVEAEAEPAGEEEDPHTCSCVDA